MKCGPAGLFAGMSIELGTIGIWRHASGLTPELTAEVEALGYGAIWIGSSPDGDLRSSSSYWTRRITSRSPPGS